MFTFYFRLDGDIIRDVITYPAEGFTEVELEVAYLPAGINAGYYRWDGTAYTIDEELRAQIDPPAAPDAVSINIRLDEQQATLDDITLALADIFAAGA